jgi:hypothetical protein
MNSKVVGLTLRMLIVLSAGLLTTSCATDSSGPRYGYSPYYGGYRGGYGYSPYYGGYGGGYGYGYGYRGGYRGGYGYGYRGDRW